MLPSKFYPLVDDIKWIEKFLPLGVKFIQLRLKEKPKRELNQQIRDALQLGKEHKAEIVINDYWDIAINEHAKWVHLGQTDLDQADISEIKNAGLKFGTSSHDHRELDRVMRLKPDYVALGPIFQTVSKKMVMPAQGLERLTEWKILLDGIDLVGIGGVTLEKAKSVLRYGADAVSCIGDVLLHETPEERVQEWLKNLA